MALFKSRDRDVTDATQGAEGARHSDDPADRPQGMIPARARRASPVERVFMRVVATAGIVGIATALGAILSGEDVDGWIIGLAIGTLSVILAGLLWSSRQL